MNESRRWESIPDRREPLTKDMVEYIIDKGKELSKTNPDNIYLSLSDWLVLGLQAGFRRMEWAQDRAHLKKYKDIQRNIDGSPAVFILKDFELRKKGNKMIDNSSNKEVSKASITNLKWRFQKNMDNGQTISYIEDNKNKKLCFVRASKRIRNRALKLKIPQDQASAVFIELKKTN